MGKGGEGRPLTPKGSRKKPSGKQFQRVTYPEAMTQTHSWLPRTKCNPHACVKCPSHRGATAPVPLLVRILVT